MTRNIKPVIRLTLGSTGFFALGSRLLFLTRFFFSGFGLGLSLSLFVLILLVRDDIKYCFNYRKNNKKSDLNNRAK